jgi:hypothetical protein
MEANSELNSGTDASTGFSFRFSLAARPRGFFVVMGDVTLEDILIVMLA